MAMTDYPEAANFLNPMPAWPVNVACKAFHDYVPKPKDEEPTYEKTLTVRQLYLFGALRDAADVYFNYEKRPGYCMDGADTGATGSLDGDGWNVLQCNQLAMPNSTGDTSMFFPETFVPADFTKSCQDEYNLTPDYDWALREFGGWDVKQDLKSYSNIVFSNGELDPWRAGGVQGD